MIKPLAQGHEGPLFRFYLTTNRNPLLSGDL